jgi:hypothetical protein
MAKFFEAISPELQDFIEAQKIFFTGTAAREGRVNVSPKGMDSLRVLSPNRVIWLNLTGSGNETAAHLLEVNRMTIMFCAFEGKPLILRLYGSAKTVHPNDAAWNELYAHFPDSHGARQIYDVTIDSVQTSCGFAVPFMDYKEERDVLKNWAEKKGPEGIHEYWEARNVTSIDGKPTGIFGE